MRFFLACFLVACGNNPVDDIVPIDTADATTTRDSSISFPDGYPPPEAEAGPVYNGGGPLACGNCTCDGTLYACLAGTCEALPPPKDASAEADAADDADADASVSCGKKESCWQIPIECLPKPTCDCITKATGLLCTVVPNGNGFALTCP